MTTSENGIETAHGIFNTNKYLVYVKAPSSTSISCQIKTHTDTITSSKGAMWVPDDKSARYDTNILYMRYWYVDKNRVGPENLR